MTSLILASASPRRVEIIEKLGFEAVTMPSDIEERVKAADIPDTPKERVAFLSQLKASDIALRLIKAEKGGDESFLVIGSDTVVSAGNRILEKPRDKEEAREMIGLLAGRGHEVYTAVTLLSFSKGDILEGDAPTYDGKGENPEEILRLAEIFSKKGLLHQKTFTATTEVMVYPMTTEEIEDYISTNEPYDKAGAYAIQGRFSRFIEGIKGDYFTVMGLPSGRLYQEMKGILGRTGNV